MALVFVTRFLGCSLPSNRDARRAQPHATLTDDRPTGTVQESPDGLSVGSREEDMDPACQLHPYCTLGLTVLWLPDWVTRQAPAVLTTGNRPAYRLTPAVHAAICDAVDGLAGRWRQSADGLTGERVAVLAKAAKVLGELWEWMATQAPTGTVATEPAALPEAYARKLVARCQAIEAGGETGRLPDVPGPYPPVDPVTLKVVSDEEVDSSLASKSPKKRRTVAVRRRGAGDAIATGTQSAGMFDGPPGGF